MPAVAIDRMEPWFAVLTTLPLLAGPGLTRAGSSRAPVAVLDVAIAARAKARGIFVNPLEAPLPALQAFASIGQRETAAMLEEMLVDPQSGRDDLEGLLSAYTSADERRLMKAFGRLVRRRPALAEHLLFRRNQAWCDRLALWLPDGGIFIAAGAFHMFGERGLVEMLRGRGYRVERVRERSVRVAP
jgi:hypothetical protein